MNHDFYTCFNFSHFSKKNVAFLVLLLIGTNVINAQTINRTIQCACIDNGAPSGQAQFAEEIQVTSGVGETWYIAEVSGLYDITSPLPPAAQIQFQTGITGEILMANDTTYILEAVVIENVAYSITLTNGIDSVSLDQVSCAYPTAEILGDNAICDGEVAIYTNPLYNSSYSYEWSINGKGVILSGTGGQNVTVDWNDETGYSGVFLNYEDENGCGGSEILNIEFEEDITMACNNLNNHSVSADCIVNISASDILEGMDYNDDSYNVELRLASTGELISNGSSAEDYLFQDIEASIEHICGENSCWGYIQLEDKYIPNLVCENDTVRCDQSTYPSATGLPLPAGAIATALNANTYEVENFDGCSAVTLSFVDHEEIYHCSTDFYSLITRIWTATDIYNNTTTCTELIYSYRSSVNDVVFPPNYDDIDLPALACDAPYPTLPNGMPTPEYTGSPSDGLCDHLIVEYIDLPNPICGNMIKLVRKWKIFNPCTNQTIVHNQIIKIADTQAPVFECVPNIGAHIEENTCTTEIEVNIPLVTFDCSEVSFIAQYYKLDQTGNINSPILTIEPINQKFQFDNLSEGLYEVKMIATDECGNVSSCLFNIDVKDLYPPVALCGSVSAIALNLQGEATVPVETFDGGSYDNCSSVSLLAKRLNTNCGQNPWTKFVEFCCADVGVIEILIMATDEAGNSSTCTMSVEIQDKKAPTITCPTDRYLNCTDDKVNLEQYGWPIADDNCSVTILETISDNFNACGIGTLTRTFTATDLGGNSTSCSQVLYYDNQSTINESDILWPQDYYTNECLGNNYHPDQLPTEYSYPIIPVNACAEFGFNYEDQIFTPVNSYCLSIRRIWSLHDNCTNKSYTSTQYIYVNDGEKPVFDECSNKEVEVTALLNCDYHLLYSKSATDNCTPESDLLYSYDIDVHNDGFLNIWEAGATIDTILPAGTHKVIWKVEDACGNFKFCTELITIKDKKAPTPYCIDGISTVVMESTGSIEIWASDFNHSSSDNCTNNNELVYSFSDDIFNTTRLFTCLDLDMEEEKFYEVDIYVHDQSGNYDFCTATLRITSNGHCDTTSTSQYDINGKVTTIDNKAIENAEIHLKNIEDNESYTAYTDENGDYSFTDMKGYMPYQITASLDDDNTLNGITTLDIVLIQKHILNIEKLNTPEKIIAADVNQSGTITGTDIIHLRKLILDVYQELPYSDTWKFVDQYAQYNNPNKPWPVVDQVEVYPLVDNMMNENFAAIKMGDVNLSRDVNFKNNNTETRTLQTIQLEYEVFNTDEGTQIDFYCNEKYSLQGFQWGMEAAWGDVEIISSQLTLNDHHYNKKANKLICSWSGDQTVFSDTPLFSIRTKTINVRDVSLLEQSISNECYIEINDALTVRNIRLEKRLASEAISYNHLLKIFQNEPNPFNEFTSIQFYNPLEGVVHLDIRNTNGQLIYQGNQHFDNGRNEWLINGEQLNYSGMLIYTITSEAGKSSGKMLKIK